MPSIVDILRYQLELDDSKFTANATNADAVVAKLGGSISGVLTGALAGLATAFSAVKIGEFIKDATLTAARTEVLGTALNQVGKNAGVSQGRLALLEEQVKALGITTQEARLSIIKFIQSGLPLEKVAKLARLAQNSAINSGLNSSEAFERLVRGIQTGQIELIRSAGIFVSIEQALNRFARESGRAREGISDLERQTVILNEVLAQSEKVAGNYEAAMQDVGKQLTSMPRYVEEATNALGNRFKPILEAIVPVLAEFAKGAEKAFTNDVIEANRKAVVLEGQREKQLKQILATQEEITRITARMVELTGRAADSFSPDRLVGIEGVLSRLKAAITVPRLSDELTELRKQLDGLVEAAGPGIDLKINTAFQSGESQKRADQIDRLLNLQKNVPAPIDIPVKVVMETEDEAIMRQLTGQELAPGEIPVVISLDDSQFRNQLEAQLRETELRFKRILEPILLQEFPGGFMSGIDQEENRIRSLQEAADVTRSEWISTFRDIQEIGVAAIGVISERAAQLAGSFVNIFGQFASGNIASGIAGVISTVFSVFASNSDKLIVTERDLIRAIESWESTVFELTDRQRAEQQTASQSLLATIDRLQSVGAPLTGFETALRDILTQAGVSVPEGASIQQLVEIANSILAELGALTISSEAIREADTRAEQNALIAQARSAAEAQLLVRSFSDLFDLSLEEQRSLLEQVMADLGSRGLLSEADRLALLTSIEDLGDRIADLADAGGATQTERSIARITERQADTITSALSTLDLHLREVGQAIVDAVRNLQITGFNSVAALAGGGSVNVGNINVYAPTGSASDISKTIVTTLEREYRAVGGQRLKG